MSQYYSATNMLNISVKEIIPWASSLRRIFVRRPRFLWGFFFSVISISSGDDFDLVVHAFASDDLDPRSSIWWFGSIKTTRWRIWWFGTVCKPKAIRPFPSPKKKSAPDGAETYSRRIGF